MLLLKMVCLKLGSHTQSPPANLEILEARLYPISIPTHSSTMATTSALARVAARSLAPSMRRSTAGVALSKQQYSSSAVSLGGATPPLAPFARIPVESEKLVEQYDAIWDDGVAPEVTLDFDCQHISSAEGLAMWLVSIMKYFLCIINDLQ